MLAIGLAIFTILIISLRVVKNSGVRQNAFLLTNLGLMTFVFYREFLLMAALSILIVVIHSLILRVKVSRIRDIFAYSLPVVFFIVHRNSEILQLVGFSYICFRMLSATHELKADVIQRFDIRDYLSYCFFFPTLKVGPIGTLRDHLESMSLEETRKVTDLNWPQLARITFGAVKYLFLAAYVKNISSAFGLDWEHADRWYELVLTGFSSYVILYLSFSGFCDIAIGICDFLGMKMKENFLQPFTAKNVSEFWSSWHVSLTDLLKELIFIPMNLYLQRRVKPKFRPHVVSFCMVILFFIVGYWHGTGIHYFYLGIYHAVAAITAYYFAMVMSRLVPDYKSSKIFQYASLVLTQTYFALSFIILENSVDYLHAW